MGTTKEDLLGAVDKLIADLAAETAAQEAKNTADASVAGATAIQEEAVRVLVAAKATVSSDLESLKSIADKLADGDPTT